MRITKINLHQQTSLGSYNQVENMVSVTIRTSVTSQGFIGLSPWLGDRSIYEFCTISKGNNPLSKIEIVSALNSFNLTWDQYYYNSNNCPQKYNPKVYLSALQTVGETWIFDRQNGQKNGLPNLPEGVQKSGSYNLLI